MTDTLRIALEQITELLEFMAADDDEAGRMAQHPLRIARAALAAAPQPAPEREERETLVTAAQTALKELMDRDPECNEGEMAEAALDALLARGLRLPGPETMAWAVIGEDGSIDIERVYGAQERSYAYEDAIPSRGETVVRVAIRVVEGGDDAA